MNRERFDQRAQSFATALAQLKKATLEPETEFLRDAVIQRFEFTYELAWKTLKLALEDKDIDVRNAKDTIAAAIEQGMVDDGNLWTEMHRMRNLTSHTYDPELAQSVYKFVIATGVVEFESLAGRLNAL